jgi:hypothetical protein
VLRVAQFKLYRFSRVGALSFYYSVRLRFPFFGGRFDMKNHVMSPPQASASKASETLRCTFSNSWSHFSPNTYEELGMSTSPFMAKQRAESGEALAPHAACAVLSFGAVKNSSISSFENSNPFRAGSKGLFSFFAAR